MDIENGGFTDLFTPPIWSPLSISVSGRDTTANNTTLVGQLLFYANQARPARLIIPNILPFQFFNDPLFLLFNTLYSIVIFQNYINIISDLNYLLHDLSQNGQKHNDTAESPCYNKDQR
jgi:hypothetical protein